MKEWLPAGTQISRFKIYARIGANGIGEVYQATGEESGSELALKLLPAALVEDPKSRRRFIETLSSFAPLSHPNLCQIYEAGVTEEGRPFVAMEYVKGQSLDLVLLSHRLTVPEIISVVLQFAETLDALHGLGWVHLMIKPSNLTMTADKQVKILDFGLGLVFPVSLSSEGEGGPKITPDAARYSSPEQLIGESPDRRSDVFSLGAVLYELVTGRPPFAGAILDEVVAAVTLATPAPVTEFREDAPAALNKIVLRALEKDPDARYQTMGELARDLRDLEAAISPRGLSRGKRGREKKAKEARASASPGDDANSELPQSLLLDDLNKAMNSFLESRPNSAWDGSSDPSLERDRSLSSDVLYFAKTYKNHLLASLLLIVGVAIAVVTVGALRDNVPDAETARSMRVTSLTTSGKVVGAAISPDGARLIYAVDEGEQQSLFLKEMKGVGETRLASSRLTEYRDLSFSPDGRWVSYFKSPAEDGVARPAGAAFQIPAYGGPEQPSPIQNAISAGSFAPDGKSLAGARATAGGSETSVWVGDESGNGVDLLTRRSPAAVQPIPPVWSPDGRLLVCATREADNDFFLKLVAVNVKTKAEQTLVSGRWAEIDRVTWRADGTGLVVAAGDPITRKSQLWRVDYPSGIVSRITQDGSDYRGVSLTRDASILISVQSEALSNVWIAPALGAEHPRQISTGRLDGLNGLSWAPDGRLAYVSWANDREGVWVVGPGFDDPQHQQAPTESGDRVQYQPAVSPDGRRMAYVSERDGGAYLYVGALDHRESVAVSKDRLSFFPQFSSDGGSVIYSAMRNGRGVIARVPSEGGSPETLVAGRAWRAVVSPDGTKLACNYLDESVARWRIAILPVTGGAPVAVYDAPGSMNRVVQWTPDGSGVAFIVTRGGVSNLWSQPLSGGPANRFTDFKTNRIFNFAWSRDGRTLALAHGWTTSDVAIIQNFR